LTPPTPPRGGYTPQPSRFAGQALKGALPPNPPNGGANRNKEYPPSGGKGGKKRQVGETIARN